MLLYHSHQLYKNYYVYFPSIINCSIINWFNIWTKNTFKNVSNKYLKTFVDIIRGKFADRVKTLEEWAIIMLSIIFVKIKLSTL